MKTHTFFFLLYLTNIIVLASLEDNTEELSRNFHPRLSDIETHPVALLMSKLKNELAQGDQTLEPVRMLDDLVSELAGPIAELTDEHYRTLQEYHLLRDTFQQFCGAVVDLFSSMKEFYQTRKNLGNIFKQLSFLSNRLSTMSNQVDNLIAKQGVSKAIQTIDKKWTELREFDRQELNKIKHKKESFIVTSIFLPDGERGVINQQMRNLDDYFVQMSLAYVEFKVHISVLGTHIRDAQDGLLSFHNEEDLIVSDVRTLEAFVRKETANMFKKINGMWKIDGGKSLVKLPRFRD